MSNGYDDGSAQAPAGAPSLATLLDGYAAPPPWSVAGVTYGVGVPTATVLKNPGAIAMAGVSVDAATQVVSVTASGVTLNGYDFTLGGGWQVFVDPGVTNTVIENSSFRLGPTNELTANAAVEADAGVGNLTLLDNSIDGGGSATSSIGALVTYNGTGVFTAEYNSFTNAPADAIDFSSGALTSIVKYNVFENLGTNPASHPDAVQYAASTSENSVFAFNTVYQPNTSGMQGIQLEAQLGSTLTNTTIENNVIVAKGPGIDMSYSIAVGQAPADGPNAVDGALIGHNYIDVTGAYGPFYPPAGSGLTFTGNVDMVKGQAFSSPAGTSSSDVSAVSASPLEGALTAGATVQIALRMDEAESVSGTPTLALNDGGSAVYVAGSRSSTLVFDYTVAPSDRPVSTLAVTGYSLSGGAAIADGFGNPANLAGALVSFAGLSVLPGSLACFAAGSMIATPDGETEVERLAPGDRVRTMISGEAEIVWVGRRQVDCERHPEPRKVWPVRVRAGTFGPGMPRRDLFLSPCHALYIDDVLIPVRCLIDGADIVQIQASLATYHHIELPRHDVVWADGLPAESFLETAGGVSKAAYEVQSRSDAVSRIWEAEGCAPLIVVGEPVDRARARIAARRGSSANRPTISLRRTSGLATSCGKKVTNVQRSRKP